MSYIDNSRVADTEYQVRSGLPGSVVVPSQVGELRNEGRRVDGADARRQVVAGQRAEALDRVEVPVLGERHGVVAFGDVDDALGVGRGQSVQVRVDQAEPVAGRLVGQRHDAGEQRRRLGVAGWGAVGGCAAYGEAGRAAGIGPGTRW